MTEILEFFSSIFSSISNLGYPLYITIALVVFAMSGTELLKIPYKLLTAKIPNETLRQKANLVIWIIPVILGYIGVFVISRCNPEWAFNAWAGLTCGFSAEALYQLVSKLFKRISDGEDITEETLTEDVKTVEKDVAKSQAEFDKIVASIKKTNGK